MEELLKEILSELKAIHNILQIQVNAVQTINEDTLKRQKDIFEMMKGMNPELAKMFNKFMGGGFDGK